MSGVIWKVEKDAAYNVVPSEKYAKSLLQRDRCSCDTKFSPDVYDCFSNTLMRG